MNIKDVRMADDKTLWIKVGAEFENIGRVIVEDGNWCKVFYQDAQPERHGRWIQDEFGDYTCSECGDREDRFIYGTENWYGNGESNFCPNCGAKIEGDQE